MINFWRNFHVYMDQADAGEGGGASAGDAGQAAGASDGASGTGEGAVQQQAGTVLAAAATEGSQSQAVAIPEKYQVRKEDGTLDIEASSMKLAEAYGHLEKRMGSGDMPPKTAGEYEIAVPEALKDQWNPKEDQKLQAFLDKAHSKGLTQGILDVVMEAYFDTSQQLVSGNRALSEEECVADLRNDWKTDVQYKAELNKSYRAMVAYAGGEEDAQYFLNQYGNDPKFIRMMNRIGGEMGEDRSLNPGGTLQGGQSIESLMSSEAYANPKHPDHNKVSLQVKSYFDKQAEAATRSGNAPLM